MICFGAKSRGDLRSPVLFMIVVCFVVGIAFFVVIITLATVIDHTLCYAFYSFSIFSSAFASCFLSNTLLAT